MNEIKLKGKKEESNKEIKNEIKHNILVIDFFAPHSHSFTFKTNIANMLCKL